MRAPRLLLAALLLAGCGSSTTSSPTPAAAPSVVPDDPGQERAVTEDDDGRELTLAPGDEVPLRLGSAWSWDAPRVTGEAVRLDPVDHLVDPGWTEWLVVAVAAGTAEVSVDGSPACPDPADCPARTVRFGVTVG